MGLLAVMGPSRKDQRRGEPSFLWRYWSTTPLSYHQRRRSRSSAGKSARVSTCRKPPFLVVVIARSPCQQKNLALKRGRDRSRGTTSIGRARARPAQAGAAWVAWDLPPVPLPEGRGSLGWPSLNGQSF